MAGSCIDQTLNDAVQVLEAGNAFVNPQNSIIGNIVAGVTGRQTALQTLILDPSLLGPQHAELLTKFSQMQGLLDNFCTDGISDSVIGRYRAYTEFLCGRATAFPYSMLGPYLSDIPGSAILAGVGFAAVLGIASGGLQVNSALCQIDPNDPCAHVKGIFGTIMGAFDAVLNAILQGINLMNDFVHLIDSYLNQIAEFIALVENKIIEALTNLVNAIMRGIHYGLAKLLQNLNLNPCFTAVVSNITSQALQAALPPSLN